MEFGSLAYLAAVVIAGFAVGALAGRWWLVVAVALACVAHATWIVVTGVEGSDETIGMVVVLSFTLIYFPALTGVGVGTAVGRALRR